MDLSQPTPLSVEQCKDLLQIVARMCYVKTELLSTRLLSKADKKDMLAGLVPLESLIVHIKVWVANGCPDYVVSVV